MILQAAPQFFLQCCNIHLGDGTAFFHSLTGGTAGGLSGEDGRWDYPQNIPATSPGGGTAAGSDDVAEAAPVATTAPSFAVSQPPAQITTQEVNSAIKENTTTVNASNVGDMVANLMAQFNNVNQ